MYELVRVTENVLFMDCPARVGVLRLPDGEAAAIDGGSDDTAAKKLLRGLEAEGLALTRVYITHAHADHVGGNALLQARTGCRIFAKENHRAVPEIIRTDYTAAVAEKVMLEYLKSGNRFDSVFTTDEIAQGVYRAMLSSGLRIPEDAAVCGCDDLPSGAVLYPSLTTISLDYEELAGKAVEFVLQRGKTGIPERVRLQPRLIVRESTAKKR